MSDVMTAHRKNPDDAVQDNQVQCSRIIILELCSHFFAAQGGNNSAYMQIQNSD